MLTSVESRAPVASRTAPTILGVMNATAQQDIGSNQTDVAVMVCLTIYQIMHGTVEFVSLSVTLDSPIG